MLSKNSDEVALAMARRAAGGCFVLDTFVLIPQSEGLETASRYSYAAQAPVSVRKDEPAETGGTWDGRLLGLAGVTFAMATAGVVVAHRGRRAKQKRKQREFARSVDRVLADLPIDE